MARIPIAGTCTTNLQPAGSSYPIELHVIPLNGFDFVLGAQWLMTLGPIWWAFTTLTMTFDKRHQWVTLHGLQVEHEQHLNLLCPTKMNRQMEKLLDEFQILFQEPTGLPPIRQCDHRIFFIPSSSLVVVCPYRYPYLQKNEIYKQCENVVLRYYQTQSIPIFISYPVG